MALRNLAQGFQLSDAIVAEYSGTRFRVWRVSTGTGRRRVEIERRIAGESEGLMTARARGDKVLGLDPAHPTLPSLLRDAGYATALFGKWHHGPPRPGSKTYTHPMDQGFDEFVGFTNAKLLGRLARETQVLTFDWENISVDALRKLPDETLICPPVPALADGQVLDYTPDLDELLRFEKTLMAIWRAIPGEVWLALYVTWVLGSIVFVVMQRRRPTATLAWIVAFFSLPLLAAPLARAAPPVASLPPWSSVTSSHGITRCSTEAPGGSVSNGPS